MTLEQWFKHLRHWLFVVLAFPSPFSDDTHFWTGEVRSNEEHCLICGAYRVMSDEEFQSEIKAWESLSDEAFYSIIEEEMKNEKE